MQNVSHLISSPVTDSGTTLSAAMEEGGREGGRGRREEGRKEQFERRSGKKGALDEKA